MMRFSEIGEQLRAYRLESGMRAEEIAARLGVSRAALYRYEKGDVIKLDTVMRLAELLKISPLSLLGIGVEYYVRPVGFFERLRQLEEASDQIVQVGGALSYLISSPLFDETVVSVAEVWTRGLGGGQPAGRAAVEHLQGVMATRKRAYQQRRPTLINLFAMDAIETMLRHGLCPALELPPSLRQRCRDMAALEVENLIRILGEDPFGVQLGLLGVGQVSGCFHMMRGRDRAVLALSPFQPDGAPDGQLGTAMITSADEAVQNHQRLVETGWRAALKGQAAADALRALLEAAK